MKHTKSMIYKPTKASNDLFLYAINDGDLYRSMTTYTIDNLRKKAVKGIYDTNKAIDSFYYIATEASRLYKNANHYFTVQERYTAAVEMEAYYHDDNIFYGL